MASLSKNVILTKIEKKIPGLLFQLIEDNVVPLDSVNNNSD